jgi:large subunit ribosomal protein L21
MFAIIEALGRQYRVSAGDLIKVDHLAVDNKSGLENSLKVGTKLAFTKVLALGSEAGSLQVGTPFLKDVSIQAEVLEHGKEAKIYPFKMKRRKGYRRKKGFRRAFSLIKIGEIKAA